MIRNLNNYGNHYQQSALKFILKGETIYFNFKGKN